MTNEQFENEYYPRYNSVIRAIARKLAQTNDVLAEECYQEGLIALWNCDPSRARDNPDAYIRQAVKFRMIDHLRKERLYNIESLEARLELGDQLVSELGDLALVVPTARNRMTGRSVERKRFSEEEEE
jgi:DNA-directed RNA polymerase specialized sigma24 family protein